jgi:hypothetical protein
MKKSLSIIKALIIFAFILTPIFAGNVPEAKPILNKVYRTGKISDAYRFLLMDNGHFYYVKTNKTDKLTVEEIKSSKILDILNSKQSWGQAFSSNGEYITKNGKIFTKRYLDRIKVILPKKIKYLNEIFTLQE